MYVEFHSKKVCWFQGRYSQPARHVRNGEVNAVLRYRV